MKLIRAIIRPEREPDVIRGLEDAGFFAMSKTPVRGRGGQRGVQVGAVSYDELSKIMIYMAVEDQDMPRVVETLETSARTNNPGDGKIFIENIRESYSIRKGGLDLA